MQDVLERVKEFTGLEAEIAGDYELAGVIHKSPSVISKPEREERKEDEIKQRTNNSGTSAKKTDSPESNSRDEAVPKDKQSGDLIKKLGFVVVCLLALIAFRFFSASK